MNTPFLTEEDRQELINSGLSCEALKKLNHFSILSKKEAQEITGIRHQGLAFYYHNPKTKSPYLRSDGKPYYRVKPRDWGDGDDYPKYLSPANEGSRPYWSCLIEDFEKKAKKKSIPLEIVEGEKKADCLSFEGFFTLGLSGVWAWLDSCARAEETEQKPAQLIEDEEEDLKKKKLEQSRLLPEIKEAIEWKGRRVNIAFDSDLWEKPDVRFAAQSLALELSKLGAIPYFIRLPTEIDGSKNGVDDLKVRHGVESYKHLCKVATRKLTWKDPTPIEKVAMMTAVLKSHWRYRPGMGWLQWAGRFWEPKTDVEFECSLIDFQDANGWREIKGVDALIRQLKGRLLVPEKEWNPSSRIIFENGTLINGKFEESHHRESFNTSVLPYQYSLEAECPTWIKFLQEAVADEAGIGLLQAFIKWVLVPKDKQRKAQIEKCLDLLGAKGTGKGTFLDVLIGLVGTENVAAIGQETFKNANALAELLDKKLSVDTDSFGFLGNIGLFNKVISNEPVTIKRLYKDVTSTRLGTVIVRAYNRIPEVPDGAEGLDRRIIAISFDRKPKVVDLELSEKLRAELPGIFQWAWSLSVSEAKRRLMAAGEVGVVKEASVKRFEANNPEFSFLKDVFPQGNRVKVSDLYSSYSDWCKESGISQKKRRKFMEALSSFGVDSARSTGGFYWATIPAMESFDVIDFLGVSRRTSGQSEESEAKIESPPRKEAIAEESSPTQSHTEQKIDAVSEESEAKLTRTFSKSKKEPETIGLGDWVKYKRSAPDSTIKVVCGSRKLQVLEFDKVGKGLKPAFAKVKAVTWVDPKWLDLKLLTFCERGGLPAKEELAQEEPTNGEELPKAEGKFKVGDRVVVPRYGKHRNLAGTVKEVTLDGNGVQLDQREGEIHGWWEDDALLSVKAFYGFADMPSVDGQTNEIKLRYFFPYQKDAKHWLSLSEPMAKSCRIEKLQGQESRGKNKWQLEILGLSFSQAERLHREIKESRK
jgi:P4 family phage/plasmid primase-like protien